MPEPGRTGPLPSLELLPERRYRRHREVLWILAFAAFVGAVTSLVTLGAGLIPPWELGLAVASSLILAGALWQWRRMALARAFPRWRDVMPCYLTIQDRDLRIVEGNRLFRDTFGKGLGRHCYTVYKQRSSPCPTCPVLMTFSDGKDHSCEEVVITKTGQEAQVVVTSTPVFDRRGRMVGALEMSTNITEVKALRRELHRRTADFQLLFDIVPCYITVHDRDLRITEGNALFRRDFGEARGRQCYEVYKGRREPCPNCPVQKSFADGQVHSSEEIVVTAKGEQQAVIVYSMPVREENGEIDAVMEVSTNITEVKRLQRELAQMGLAVAGMAHRIKNILMGLEGGIFVVNTGFEEKDQATVEQGWDMVERNVGKISRLVKDLLYCSKERSPTFKPEIHPLAIVQEVYELYRPRTERDGIHLRIEAAPGVQPGCYDPAGLSNLLTNLVGNAVDACRFNPTPPSGGHTITLRCRPDAAGIVLEVEDDGPGIPDDVKHKVFENFFSTKGTEGTGLGLLVVQKVAHEHGGTVHFRTRVGEGTCFIITLPGRTPKPQACEPGTAAA